mmetsp:Transcript_19937/g.20269  ORF Transcript_19937/g.20269 Transcript_19937/m.20269 type:complete len:177 (-) Transcript_19937:828-1358(-)
MQYIYISVSSSILYIRNSARVLASYASLIISSRDRMYHMHHRHATFLVNICTVGFRQDYLLIIIFMISTIIRMYIQFRHPFRIITFLWLCSHTIDHLLLLLVLIFDYFQTLSLFLFYFLLFFDFLDLFFCFFFVGLVVGRVVSGRVVGESVGGSVVFVGLHFDQKEGYTTTLGVRG